MFYFICCIRTGLWVLVFKSYGYNLTFRTRIESVQFVNKKLNAMYYVAYLLYNCA